MTATAGPIVLSPSDEERAKRLHRESTVFICHDHSLFPEDFTAMARGGVTAKQLMLSVDARLHAERETFLASIRGRGYARESKRHERSVGTIDEEIGARPLGATESDGFLKSALVAMDYVYWQVERSKGRIRVAFEPDDVRAAKKDGAIAIVDPAQMIDSRQIHDHPRSNRAASHAAARSARDQLRP